MTNNFRLTGPDGQPLYDREKRREVQSWIDTAVSIFEENCSSFTVNAVVDGHVIALCGGNKLELIKTLTGSLNVVVTELEKDLTQ